MTLAFYISGHGFGHAARAAALIRHLLLQFPHLHICVRTSAPKSFFQSLSPKISVVPTTIDSGAIEAANTLAIDAPATLRNLQSLPSQKSALIRHEAESLRRAHAACLIADIPFLAADIAQLAGIPAIAVGNFTWDWIYEPMPGAAPFLPAIDESYSKFTTLLHLPFGQTERLQKFPSVEPAPLLVSRSTRPHAEILNQLGIQPSDPRPRIFLGMRATLSPQALATAATQLPGYLILPPSTITPHLTFQDILSVSHIIVSKLGYGIAAECAASRIDLLYPIRTGFREDSVLAPQLNQYIRTAPLSPEAFASGHWAPAIQTLQSQPSPQRTIPHNGAEFCASRIAAIAGLPPPRFGLP